MFLVAKAMYNCNCFYKEYKICVKIYDSTAMPLGTLQLLLVFPKWFHSWSLDFVAKLPESYKCNAILSVVNQLIYDYI